MKATTVITTFLLILPGTFQLTARQNAAQSAILEDVKARAENGDIDAQVTLGRSYATGLGVPKNYEEAVKWYRRAADQNDTEAQLNMGKFYFDGNGVVKDRAVAVRWWTKAADQNSAEAQCNLGNCYHAGIGVTLDHGEAFKWFKKAASQNLRLAQLYLGLSYQKGLGVTNDPVEAVKWYQKAAEQNLAEAQCNLGGCYYIGVGVPKNYEEAVKWYRRAADQNFANAECNLGNCYCGGNGVLKNYEEAVKLFRKAADQNQSEAQFNLGKCYEEGAGVAKDCAEAAKWYRRAAEQNFMAAQLKLGFCFHEGQGLAKNDIEAYRWLLIAAKQGNEPAKEYITKLEKAMSPKEIEEAKKLTSDNKRASPPSVSNGDLLKASMEKASLGEIVEMKIPIGVRFIDKDRASAFLNQTGNSVPAGLLGMMAHNSADWFAVMQVIEIGYMKDVEKDEIDSSAILQALRNKITVDNKKAVQRGSSEISSIEWEKKPKYYPSSHTLAWATRVETAQGQAINYSAVVLGRKGAIEFTAVQPAGAVTGLALLEELVKNTSFKTGFRYGDYQSGDKVATKSILDLVVDDQEPAK